jgi:tyrosine-protein kinase Etk/Wzc
MKKINESDSTNAVLKHFLLKIYSYRYFYIVCIVLFVGIAFLFNRYTPKVFEITSTIGPTQNNPSSMISSNKIFGDGAGYNANTNGDDIINSLKSFSLVSSVVNGLNLEVTYYTEKKSIFKRSTEIYLESPFIINYDKSHIQPIDTKFYILPLNDSIFKLTAINNKTSLYNYIDNQVVKKDQYFRIDTICKYNRTLSNKYFKFSVTHNKDYDRTQYGKDDLFCFKFHHLESLAKNYLDNLDIKQISVFSSIIKISFTGENIQKCMKFVDTYISFFLDESLAKKNKIAVSTINFIDSQISGISDSLSKSESKLTNYKAANQVMDLSVQGQQLYQKLSQTETDRANLEAQVRYYNYVLNYFKTNQDGSGIVPPLSANIVDPLMNQLITDLVTYNAEKSRILANSNEKNLFLEPIQNKIKLQKQAIIENVTNNLNSINITLNELNYKTEKYSKEISSLPKTEINVVNMQRKFNLNDAILTYFLQKRSESEITLASNFPEYEVIEPARFITSDVIKPRTKLNYLLALFIALLIPTAFFFIKDFLNDKIESTYDVEHLAERSVLGVIYSNLKKYENVVAKSPNSIISESFRSLRSSLIYKLKNEKTKTILITSSQPKDGKSFVSFNLAASIASVGFKTIIIDCDLRRPVLHDKLTKDNSKGVSNFLVDKVRLDEIIQKTSVENLSFIPAGPLLPNPSELIDLGLMGDLLNTIKEDYDYIIIDTPPIGLVGDAVQLMKYASHILLITRINSTQKSILGSALSSLESNNIENYDIIINDMDLKRSQYSGYSDYYVKD